MKKLKLIYLALFIYVPLTAAQSGFDSDNGNDPKKPGYTVKYLSNDCSGPEVGIQYDECGGSRHVYETVATPKQCGAPPKLEWIDCQKVCGNESAQCLHTFIKDHWGQTHEDKPVGYCACTPEALPQVKIAPKWKLLRTGKRTKLEFELYHNNAPYLVPNTLGFNLYLRNYHFNKNLKFFIDKSSKHPVNFFRYVVLVKKGESKGSAWIEATAEEPISDIELTLYSADEMRKIPPTNTKLDIIDP